MMILLRAVAVLLVMAGLAGPTVAHEIKSGRITIIHPWTQPTKGAGADVIVRFKIKNGAARGDRLVSATSPRAAAVELRSGASKPSAVVKDIAVKAKAELALSESGPHLVLKGVTKPLGAYETFPLKLTFARAGTVTVDVMVEE